MAQQSGAIWITRFPASKSLSDLSSPFRENAKRFIDALTSAGATVTIANTYRPPERIYLMHWSWMIFKRKCQPADVPPMTGVDITWSSGNVGADIAAATQMAVAFGIASLAVAPALNATSRHLTKSAIDMNISWAGNLTIKSQADQEVKISSAPRTGMNKDLQAVGRSYGVIKFHGGDKDRPHWSIDDW
ncbi:hypothetical protein [Acetobacter nitrogenifigens]|uniref:hypothetical protein n=1 Tax=Acetobacter nitrogenifigens TaxID=285268 RepID=UPI00047C40E2|nr:hypothetical protein [Acetobacter nitrogenifigens]